MQMKSVIEYLKMKLLKLIIGLSYRVTRKEAHNSLSS